MAMAKRFNVDTYPTFVDGDNVYVNSTGQRSTYSDTGPTGTAPPDPLILPDLALVVSRLNEMASEIDVERPYDAPQAPARDGQIFESWIKGNSLTPQFRDIVPVATRPIFGAEPRTRSRRAAGVGKTALPDSGAKSGASRARTGDLLGRRLAE